MAWSQLDITDPHLVYIILGGFTSLFMLCSSVIKERMYIGEATVATLCGVIFGPHGANLIDPNSWGSTDIVTIEFSRIVLVVQCFAVGVELPRFYMEKHWKSVVILLIPVMMFGWLIVSLFLWWLIPGFNWLDGLVVAACITATDPVLASSVVGKGKFSKRVPKHLRDLLSAESGCNDGMAFPFVYLALYLIQFHRAAGPVTFNWIVNGILYQCVFGSIFGFIVGYAARRGIRYAEKHDLIDRESFLVFYFVVALFCAGAGSILGVDDLLVGFAAGVGFSNDGWFGAQTDESHVSNVIDLLLNLTYFVYLGTIIPWEQYNSGVEGLYVWRLIIIAILVILFRRIPIMLAMKPFIPDVKTWREALFAGHFGPIGVGAIFVAIMARAHLEHEEPVPLAHLPPQDAENYHTLYLVWPIVTFIVISSILIHGSSVAVFTLGKRINTLSLTMSYTAAPEDGPTWMNRLPRISSISRSQAKASEGSFDEKEPDFPPGTLAPPGGLLRRRRDDDGSRHGSRTPSVVSRRRRSRKTDEAGGPISQSAIYPSRDTDSPTRDGAEGATPPDGEDTTPEMPQETGSPRVEEPSDRPTDAELRPSSSRRGTVGKVSVYSEGPNLVLENEDGDVLDVVPSRQQSTDEELPTPVTTAPLTQQSSWTLEGMRRKLADMYSAEVEKRKGKDPNARRHEAARAYQFGNTIILEDEDGEVIKTYELPSQKPEGQGSGLQSSLKYVGLGGLAAPKPSGTADAPPSGDQAEASSSSGRPAPPRSGWASWLGAQPKEGSGPADKGKDMDDNDDKKIRFTIGNEGKRMTKDDFLSEVQKLDSKTRRQIASDLGDASRDKRAAAPRAEPSANIPTLAEEEKAGGSEEGDTSTSTSGRSPDRPQQPSSKTGETAVERRRRLSVLRAQEGGRDEDETPAERRRREAALGMGDDAAAESDEEDRQQPGMRIRFADQPARGRK